MLDGVLAVDDTYFTSHDQPLEVNDASSGVLGNDSLGMPAEWSGVLTASLGVGPSHGTVSLNADGTFVYTPDAGYIGTDTFDYVATADAESDTGTVTVSVGNHLPEATAIESAYYVTHDQDLSVTTPAITATDFDDNDLTPTVATDVSHGDLDFHADGSFDYTPDAGYVGEDSFAVTYSDPHGGVSNAVTITIGVTNSPPTSMNDDGYFALADSPLTVDAVHGVLVNDSDMDIGDEDRLQAVLVTNGQWGTVSLSGDGGFTYQIAKSAVDDPAFTGTDHFTYKATDGLAQGNEVTVTIAAGKLRIMAEDNGFPPEFVEVTGQTRNTTNGVLNSVVAEVTNLQGDATVTFTWYYDPGPIKTYSLSTNTVTELTAADLTNAGFSWYWATSTGVQQISVIANVKDSDGMTIGVDSVETFFNVASITASVAFSTGEVQLNGSKDIVGFGSASGIPGIKATATDPSVQGSFAWVQVVNNSYVTRTNAAGNVQSFRITDAYDGSNLPYDYGNVFADSPFIPLGSQYERYTREDHFSTYLLFRPQGATSIFVPLMQFQWSWSTIVEKDGNGEFQIEASSKQHTSVVSHTVG